MINPTTTTPPSTANKTGQLISSAADVGAGGVGGGTGVSGGAGVSAGAGDVGGVAVAEGADGASLTTNVPLIPLISTEWLPGKSFDVVKVTFWLEPALTVTSLVASTALSTFSVRL